MIKQWEIKACAPEVISRLAREADLPPLVIRLLVNRGITELSAIHSFLFHSLKDLPNPFLLQDMNRAVDRILTAMERKEKIVVYGDYDVDGTTATSMLLLFFHEIGFPVHFYIPHRMREGYSLNVPALSRLKNEGAHLLITVDNGISASKEATACREMGLDLIITDHHIVPFELPAALAVVNPQRLDCAYPAKEICGTGVAFNLMLALRQRLREAGHFKNRPEPNLKRYLDLVALATVADVVPLVGANRIFVRAGLKEMESTRWPGLKVLMEKAGVASPIDTFHVGFRLGPRLNACGRLYDATAGVRLLTSADEAEARTLADELEAANLERRDIEGEILKQAIARIEQDAASPDRASHVLFDEGWHPGVLGIVASRIVERYGRPTILLGRDGAWLKGSGRSVAGVNMIDALNECTVHLVKFGGHKAAAGVSLEEDQLANFKNIFDQSVKKTLHAKDCFPVILVDAELKAEDVIPDLLREIERLAPFGHSNPEPLFSVRNITMQNARLVADKHLKFRMPTGSGSIEAIAFGQAEHLQKLNNPVDLAFSLKWNSYHGNETLNVHVKDIHF